MIVLDDFLDTYDELKAFSQVCEFKDEENTIDGVTYPYICSTIPDNVKEELLSKIQPSNYIMFMRMSPKGVHVPHVAHTDNSMGQCSLMLYLNDDVGGTAFLRHKDTGICYAPEKQEYLDITVNDMNNAEAWDVIDRVPMKQNRVLVFNSHLFHRAEPIGGFGVNQNDARIVLTCFYDKTSN